MKVELSDIEPAIWRRFEVASNIELPQLHAVLQAVMGWNDSHLHEFAVATQRYAMQFSLDEDDDGSAVPEDGVLIEDVMPEVGSSLVYDYDFGDGWSHTVSVESITDQKHVRRAQCVAGERACPPDDCGGPGGYADLVRILADPHHDDYEQMRSWAGPYDPEAFDLDAVNDILRRLETDTAVLSVATSASPYIAQMFTKLVPRGVPALMTILAACDFGSGEVVDDATAAKAFTKVLWFLDHIGDEGITLTSAGYLPPTHVEAVRDQLDWGNQWWGVSTRESDHREVFRLREVAQLLGLTRTIKKRLQLTKAGAKLRGNPVGLWNHAASRLPFGKEKYEIDASVLYLIAMAGAAKEPLRDAMMLETMPRLGWMGDVQLYEWNDLRSTTMILFDMTVEFDPNLSVSTKLVSPAAQLFARDCLRHVRP